MDKSERKPIEPITIEWSGSELPEDIVARLPERPAADARFIVTVESAESEEEKLEWLRQAIQEGLDDIEAGRVYDAEEVFAELKSRFPQI
jgi:predicted transcriptional regulator